MTVSVALSSSLNTGTGTSQSTGAVATTSGKTQLLAVAAAPGLGESGVPTISGWTLVGSINYNPADVERTVSLFRRSGTGSTITSTITFATSQDEFQWHWFELTGANESSGDGASAIVNVVTALGNSAAQLATLAAFQATANATLGLVGLAGGGGALTVGAGFTSVAQTSGTVQGDRLLTQFRNDNDTTVNATSVSADFWGVIAIELRDASSPVEPFVLARGVGTGGNLINHTITFPAVPSGATLIVLISIDNGEALTGIPADATLDSDLLGAFDKANFVSIPNITDGRTTFDFEIATQSSCIYAWWQVSGLAASAPFDQAIRATGSGTSLTSGDITTGGDSYFGIYHISSVSISMAAPVVAGSGYTLQEMSASYMYVQDDNGIGAAGVKNTSMSWANSQVVAGVFVTYKAASSAPLTATRGQFDPELDIRAWF